MKRKNIWNRICAAVLAGVLAFPVFGMTAQATEGDTLSGYEAENSYILNYAGEFDLPQYRYVSPFKGRGTYLNEKERNIQSIMFNLYYSPSLAEGNVKVVGAFCMDAQTSPHDNAYYKRINLEDSSYAGNNVGLVRSIVLNGFPHVPVDDLKAKLGLDSLTLCEALHGTQLAIWKATHGDWITINDIFEVKNNVGTATSKTKWYGTLKSDITFFDACDAEFKDCYATAKDENVFEGHVKAVYDYLMSLEPVSPASVTVSNSSFESWSQTPGVKWNEDGTFDVTVSATVKVQKSKDDKLTLSAVLGQYYTSVTLENGKNTKELTLRNIPAEYATQDIKIVIDGKQTVGDVFAFETAGGRKESQCMVGYCDLQLPVHAEVTVKPERVLHIYKSAQTVYDPTNQQVTSHDRMPLSDIVFDLYYVAAWDEYTNGKVNLPEEITNEMLGPYPTFTVTTNESGYVKLSLSKNNLPDGVYIVRERPNEAVKEPVAPFYIMIPYTNEDHNGWKYELTIHPKNTVITPDIKKDVTEIENNIDTVDAGEEFTWIVRGDIPADIANAKSYVISDTLDYRLSYAEDLVVKVEKTDDKADNSVSSGDVVFENVLQVKKDYEVSVIEKFVSGRDNKPEATKEIKVTLKKEGLKKIAALVGKNNVEYELRVYFNTIIDEDAVMGENIPNKATLDYKNAANFDFKVVSDEPVVYTCGINLKKYDAKDDDKLLAGATFKVARKATADEIADVNVETSTLVIGRGEVETVVYVDFYNNKELVGERVDFVVTDDKGAATIYGLAEIFEADPKDEEKDGDGIKTADYYLVETKAPAGYNLLSYPVKVKLNEVSHTEANILGVANSNRFELPATGGIGTTIFTLVGAALTLGSGAVLAGKKRKEEEE